MRGQKKKRKRKKWSSGRAEGRGETEKIKAKEGRVLPEDEPQKRHGAGSRSAEAK